jgi:hypothetical protein
MNKIKRHFWEYGMISGYSFIYIAIMVLALMLFGVDNYQGWQCGNYQKITGLESRYISWDACYIKTSEDGWVRYDSNYKNPQ